MLDGVIKNLGYTVGKQMSPEKRMEIIEKISRGELSADRAAELLKGAQEAEETQTTTVEESQGEKNK